MNVGKMHFPRWHAIVNHGIWYEWICPSECLSVCLSVCHTHESCRLKQFKISLYALHHMMDGCF